MKRITNIAIKKWNKSWGLWKLGVLKSPLNKLLTYCNFMCNGHYTYLKQFKNEYLYNNHLRILKQYLPKHHINNLIEAKLIYDSYKTKEQKKNLKQNEEEIFQKYDEIYLMM